MPKANNIFIILTEKDSDKATAKQVIIKTGKTQGDVLKYYKA